MIELVNVDYSYDKKPFIEGLCLRVRENAVTTILGPNGCGKSTVLKLVSGLLSPKRGQIMYRGQSVTSLTGRECARKVAHLQQGHARADMTVQRLAMAGRFPHQGMFAAPGQEDWEKVEQALEMTGCRELRKKNLRQLSGGELQRAYLAMAFAQDTEVILLDEPTAHLDLHHCHELMALVERMRTDWGKTVLMVLHDLDLALRHSQRIAVMKSGRLLWEGPCEEVRESGLLEQVFSVNMRQFSEAGKEYYCFDSVKDAFRTGTGWQDLADSDIITS